jgi:hypothetical protein
VATLSLGVAISDFLVPPPGRPAALSHPCGPAGQRRDGDARPLTPGLATAEDRHRAAWPRREREGNVRKPTNKRGRGRAGLVPGLIFSTALGLGGAAVIPACVAGCSTPAGVADVAFTTADSGFSVAAAVADATFGVADLPFGVADTTFSVADISFTDGPDLRDSIGFDVADNAFSVADMSFDVTDGPPGDATGDGGGDGGVG